jgi:hypothetical protein
LKGFQCIILLCTWSWPAHSFSFTLYTWKERCGLEGIQLSDKCMENVGVPGEDSSPGKARNVEIFLVLFRQFYPFIYKSTAFLLSWHYLHCSRLYDLKRTAFGERLITLTNGLSDVFCIAWFPYGRNGRRSRSFSTVSLW